MLIPTSWRSGLLKSIGFVFHKEQNAVCAISICLEHLFNSKIYIILRKEILFLQNFSLLYPTYFSVEQ